MGDVAKRSIRTTTWKRGQSGNPGGRVPLTKLQREAVRLLKDLSFKSVQRLETMLDSDDERMVFAAASTILARLPVDQPVPSETAPTGQSLGQHLAWLAKRVQSKEGPNDA